MFQRQESEAERHLNQLKVQQMQEFVQEAVDKKVQIQSKQREKQNSMMDLQKKLDQAQIEFEFLQQET